MEGVKKGPPHHEDDPELEGPVKVATSQVYIIYWGFFLH